MTTPTKKRTPILSVCTAPVVEHEAMTPAEAQDVAEAQATSSFDDALAALRQAEAEAEADGREALAAVMINPAGGRPFVLMGLDEYWELTEAAFGPKP
ncbi:MAG: hypothetical protein KAH44_13630 [Oricola sp.]|nr:hypothetical protein [Oricola sp.]